MTMLSVVVAAALMPMPRSVEMRGGSVAAKARVLGAECCMWSECVWNEYDLAWKLWPRACAFVAVQRRRLIAAGVNCAPVE